MKTTDLIARLRSLYVDYDMNYVLEAADMIEAAHAVGIRQEQLIMYHEKEIQRLRTELANVNNEFGSQTADWPNAWERVAELKQHSNDRWREGERLKALNSSLTDKANAYLIENARLADEAARLRTWIVEAIAYVGCESWSPSLEREGMALLLTQP